MSETFPPASSDAPRAGIIGWPVDHSRSPLIHGYWLKAYGLHGEYGRYPVAPDAIETVLKSFADQGLVGANVTVPHKEVAYRLCNRRDEAATALGAVNTLWLEDGRLVGGNTDGFGFLANLDHGAPGWDATPGSAVVLGAGGAARAILWALKDRGFSPIHVVNRTRARAEKLVVTFGAPLQAHDWEDLPDLLAGARILVNTTTLGMHGQPPLSLDLAPLGADALVTDIVYAPLETPLLADARRRGLATVDGLGMLLHQAVPGFARWFGVTPKVTPALRALLVEDMEAAA